MTKATPDQLELEITRAYQEEVMPLGITISPMELDWERRIKLWNLVARLGDVVPVPEDYASQEALTAAEPRQLEKGVYVAKFSPLWRAAEGKVDLPGNKEVWEQAAEAIMYAVWENKKPPVPAKETTVIFPADEAKRVGYYAKALADRARTNTRAANMGETDRDQVNETVGRSAHHQLEGYEKKMERLLQGDLITEREVLKSLFRDMQSHWRGHSKAINLDKRRRKFEDTIHLMAETSATTLQLEDSAIKALHRAIRSNLYKTREDEGEDWWHTYLLMVGRHNSAKIDRVAACLASCRHEMALYQPFIDRKAQSEAQTPPVSEA